MPRRIDVDEMIRLAASGALVIDVLPADVFADVHIPDSTSLPLATMTSADLDEFDRSRTVVVYCHDQH